jgi:isochorismate synthase
VSSAFALISNPSINPKKVHCYRSNELKGIKTQDIGEIPSGSFVFSPWHSYTTFYLDEYLGELDASSIHEHLNSISDVDGLNLFEETQNGFEQRVEKAKNAFRNALLEKVVVARTKKISMIKGLDILEVFYRLVEANPNSLVYLMKSSQWGTWVGATPELLVEFDGKDFQTMSLAGTLFSDVEEWSSKEAAEQSVTSSFIEEVIGWDSNRKPQMQELNQGRLRHLMSVYRLPMKMEKMASVLTKLSPTPAVSGYPVKLASDYLQQTERMERSLYAGFIGSKSGENWKLHVNLRCAQILINDAFLYAGCGINASSNPRREWEETQNKMRIIEECLF